MSQVKMYLRNKTGATWVLQSGFIVPDSINIVPTIDESLDTGSFTFISDSLTSRIKPFTQCKLEFVDALTTTTEYFYATSDCSLNVQTGRATHNVRLVEVIKILEKIQCEGLSFFRTISDPNSYTIADVIERLNNTHKKENDLFVLSSSLDYYLGSLKAPEFQFEAGMTLRQCLKMIGDYINAVPRLYGSDFNDLTFDFYNKIGNALDLSTYNLIAEGQAEEDFCLSGGDVYDNVFADSEKANIIVYPYELGYITPRGSDLAISQDDAVIKVPNPIYKLKQLTANYFYGKAYAVYNVSGLNSSDEYIEVTNIVLGEASPYEADVHITYGHDITDYVLLKQDYDVLDAKDSGSYDSKEYRLNYRQNGNTIEGLNYSANYEFGVSGERAIYNILSRMPAPTGDDAIKFVEDNSLDTGSVVDVQEVEFTSWAFYVPNNVADNKIFNLLFNVRFQTTSSGRCNSYKDDNSEASSDYYDTDLHGIIGQSYRSGDLKSIGRANWSKTQKLGNRFLNYVVKFTNYSEIPALNSYYGDYILTKKEIQFLGDKDIRVKFYLDKGYNRVNEYLDINQKWRTWDIVPNEYVWRRTVSNEFVVVGAMLQSPTYSDDNTTLSETFKDDLTAMFGYLNGDADTLRAITYADCDFIYTPYQHNIGLPVDSVAFGKSIRFSIKTANNFSAGTISAAVTGTSDYRTNQELVYTDGYGRNSGLNVYFYPRQQSFDSMSQANRIARGQALPNLALTPPYITPSMEYENSSYDKSAGEAIQFTKAIHFVAHTSDYIVGFGLSELNPTITEDWELPDLYLFYSLSRIPSSAVSIYEYSLVPRSTSARDYITKTIDTSTINIVPSQPGYPFNTTKVKISVDLPNTILGQTFAESLYKAWAITDANGLIILGANKTSAGATIEDIYLNFTNKL